MCDNEENALVIIEGYEPGQVVIYIDASVPSGRAGVGVYAIPSKVSISNVVASSTQADGHLTKLPAISEAANWPCDPTCMAVDQDGSSIHGSRIRMFSGSQSALHLIRSWRAAVCQELVTKIMEKL